MTVKTEQDVYKNFINGEWVESGVEEVYEVTNPADKNDVVGRFPLSTEKDVDKAVKKCA
ncbi:aldehyde dehydrogenase [Halalkalibacter wakoensis JCM 9140]|uniref:Aldehyde dehydrogenase n=1 Tax=Halalkalibacter wakoensis JCM 9140 TaxID=1236970 RepID=W4Q6V2_9BACI|nr:hypothetical protein [Halalkalibacter wakoensis]GAE27732.1 aldehyde dehydrogenase [Halalkalibacter wakoensis JCM 9140]